MRNGSPQRYAMPRHTLRTDGAVLGERSSKYNTLNCPPLIGGTQRSERRRTLWIILGSWVGERRRQFSWLEHCRCQVLRRHTALLPRLPMRSHERQRLAQSMDVLPQTV